jgi:hypothetical protein
VAEEASRANAGISDQSDLTLSNPSSPQDSLGMVENDNTSQLASESLNETEGEERLPLPARSSSDYLRRRWSPPPIIMRKDNGSFSARFSRDNTPKPRPLQYWVSRDSGSKTSTDDGDVNESNEPLTGVFPRPFQEGNSKDLQTSRHNESVPSLLSFDGSLRTDFDVEGVSNVSGHEIRLQVDDTLPLSHHLSSEIENHTPQLVLAEDATNDPGIDSGIETQYGNVQHPHTSIPETPPARCHSCNRADTLEWRRGPDGARTLCNACGLRKSLSISFWLSSLTGVRLCEAHTSIFRGPGSYSRRDRALRRRSHGST